MKRTGALILAVLLLLVSAGCSEKTAVEETDGAAAVVSEPSGSEAQAEEPAAEEETLVNDSLPELDLGGRNISFFYWTNVPQAEFFVDDLNGENVNDAIFNRNQTVYDRLNVTFSFDGVPGANAERASFVSAIQASILAGGGDYDIVAGYSMTIASLATKQLTSNLLKTAYLDFSKPWWPDSLIGETTVGDYLPFASGDISTNMLYYMYGVFFNKTFLTNYNLENPYDMVQAGTWTIDNMFGMANGVYTDLNGNGEKDVDDAYGFTTHSTYVDPFYYGSGLHVCERDADGNVIFSPDFSSEKTTSLLEKLCAYFYDTNDNYRFDDYEIARNCFIQDRALFYQGEVVFGVRYLRDTEFGYGLVPITKWDEQQSDYVTTMSFPYSLYCIPIDVTTPDESGAVLECLASESYRQVSPELFEVALKVKYSEDKEAALMYDIIRAGVSFDIGRVFNDSMSSLTYSLFRSAVVGNNTNWASVMKANQKVLNKYLDKVLSALVDPNP